jgi:hypothetical protein
MRTLHFAVTLTMTVRDERWNVMNGDLTVSGTSEVADRLRVLLPGRYDSERRSLVIEKRGSPGADAVSADYLVTCNQKYFPILWKEARDPYIRVSSSALPHHISLDERSL